MDSFIDSVIDIVFYDSKINFSSFFKTTKKNIENKIKVENLVNNYLKNQNKKLLLIIDNMDRIDIDKVKFLLKSVSAILDFERTIYVLLYDETIIEKELSKIFGTEEYNKKYLDKIVQLKIDVPPVDLDVLEKIKEKLANNITFDNKKILKDILNSELKFNNIRELKIFINSTLSSMSNELRYLNIEDMVNLDYIKNKNIDLYYNIWNNRSYYITDDRIYESNIYTINYDELNRKAREYFDKLFSIEKNKQFEKVMVTMFPNVKNYFDKSQIFNSNYRDKEEYQKGVIENRIYNARYFQLYFTKNENDFIWINSEVNNIIRIINNKKIIFFEEKLQELINTLSFDELRIFMEVFELKRKDIYENKKLDVAITLYRNKNIFHDRVLFFGLDSMRRCEVIISKILTALPQEEFGRFCDYISDDYKNLYTIEEIEYWMSKETNKVESYVIKIEEIYKNLCSNIIKKNINIYLDENYNFLNLWTLYRYNNVETINYIAKVIDEKNVFRFLKDLITRSTGNGYGYSIDKKNIEKFAENIDIDKLIKKHKVNLTKDEELIKKIYENSKIKEAEDEDSIYSSEYIEFNDV